MASNTLLNISMITKESLRVLKNQLGFTKGVNRQYDSQFAKGGAKIGDVLNIRKPVRYSVSSGATIDIQNQTDQQTPLTLDRQRHVAFEFSSKELALNIDEFSDRYIKPAVIALANQIDYDGLGLSYEVPNLVGTAGTTPNALLTYLQAAQRLNENACPVDDMRTVCINPAAESSIVDALKGLFQSSSQIKEQYEKGMMGRTAGFKFKMDQNVRGIQAGAQAGTPLVDGSSQDGGSLDTDGWTASTDNVLRHGDIFTIAGVHAVNPQNRVSTGNLRQFVVRNTVDSDSSGEATVNIYPHIQASGAYQTVDSAPADNAAITVVGSASTRYANNLAFHKDAFVLAMADLPLPGGVDMAARATDPDAGLSVRIVKQYDISTDQFPCRLDVLYGWAAVYPELACRIIGESV